MTTFATFVTHQTGSRHTNARHWTNCVTAAEKKHTLREHADRRPITNGNT